MHEVHRSRLRTWVVDTFFVDQFEDSTSFLKNRLIDSTGMMELVVFIESEFDFRADDTELVPDNLDSIDNLIRYIARKKGPRLENPSPLQRSAELVEQG